MTDVSRPPPLDAEAFAIRIGQEVERSTRYARPITLGVLLVRPSLEARVARLAASRLRRSDIVATLGNGRVVLLLPEVVDTAQMPVQRLLARLADDDPEVRAGLAVCPTHGQTDADLFAAALQAAGAAPAGQVAWAEGDDVHHEIGGQVVLAVDPAMQRVFREIKRLAPSRMSVLITGETGTGKEALAHALHQWSPHRAGGWHVMNFAALTESLAESELFGVSKSSATGVDARPGLFELADGGTLFLDELTEAPVSIQAKLLRALQNGEVRRVGSAETKRVDVRVVAATNRRPEDAIAAGRLRPDLYYRLEAARIEVPPLRARPLDIPALARLFLRKHRPAGMPPLRLEPEAEQALLAHRWPGNVRELENRMRYIAEGQPGARVRPEHVRRRVTSAPTGVPAVSVDATPETFRPIDDEVDALIARRMRQALARTGGNRTQAAALLSMSRRTFHDRMKKFGISAVQRAE